MRRVSVALAGALFGVLSSLLFPAYASNTLTVVIAAVLGAVLVSALARAIQLD